jgi:hypothetical protein
MEYMLIVTDDNYSITSKSRQVWEDQRHLFGTFIEARVYARWDGAVIDGRLFGGNRELAVPPSMVLIDEAGNELWLSGMACGYAGTGPGGAAVILQAEGFGEISEEVLSERFVKIVLRKEEDGTVTSQFTERGTTLWDGEERIVRWLWRQGKVPAGADRAAEVARLMWDDPYGFPPHEAGEGK